MDTQKNLKNQNLDSFQTPFFLFSEEKLLRNLSSFKQALKEHWPNYKIAYSVKTNPLLGICQFMSSHNCWVEVTSPHEINILNKLGTDVEFVYNGIYKNKDDINAASIPQGIINIDGWTQLEQILELPKETRPKQLGLRLTPTFLEEAITWDKFGISINNGNIDALVKKLQESDCSEISCIHCHVGTNIFDPHIYYQTAVFLAEKIKLLESKGFRIKFIDVGGGFPPINESSKIIKHIEHITNGLKDAGISQDKTLIIEPGRSLVESAADFYTKVIDIRKISGKKVRYAIVDGGVNMVMGVDLVGQRLVSVGQKTNRAPKKYNVYGSLCTQSDIFANNILLPELKIGDTLIIHDTGAYDLSTSYSFSFLRPPVYLLKVNGEISLLRKNETSEYVFQLER
jgi:diaminopimelate decarboxylase